MSNSDRSLNSFKQFLLATERKPRNIVIKGEIVSEDKQGWLDIFEVKGSFIDELKIGVWGFDIGELLVNCVNLEKLCVAKMWETLKDINVDRRLHMPKLKVLEMAFLTTGNDLNIFSNVRSLEVFIVTGLLSSSDEESAVTGWLSSSDEESAKQIEDFIIQQDNLKILVIDLKTERGLFPKSRLGEVKFQLKCLHLSRSAFESPNEFYKTQSKSLKELKLQGSKGLNVSALTKLETLEVEFWKSIDWKKVSEDGVRNYSVKTVTTCHPIFPPRHLEHIFEVFPNVTRVEVRTNLRGLFKVDHKFEMSSERLKALTLRDYRRYTCISTGGISAVIRFTNVFNYQPRDPSTDLAQDAANIIDFISNHEFIGIIKIVIKSPTDPVTDWPTSFELDVRCLIPNLQYIEVEVLKTNDHVISSSDDESD